MFVPPLKIHLSWSRQSTEAAALARELYGFLRRPIGENWVLAPGLDLPVELGRDLVDLSARLGSDGPLEPPATTRLVVPILDQAAYADAQFRPALSRLLDGSSAETGLRVLPIVQDSRWYGSLADQTSALDQLAAISSEQDVLGHPSRGWILGASVGVVAARLLPSTGPDAKPRVFLSHTKHDLEATDHLAEALRDHFETRTQLDTWFDANNVARGELLGGQLAEAASHGVLVIVRTDEYSASPWCGTELLDGKSSRVPLVTVNATIRGERVASAYGGNHRTVTWRTGMSDAELAQLEWEVVGRCVQAWLGHHHFMAHGAAALARVGLPSDSTVIPRRPELLDLCSVHSNVLVYPDPPMQLRESEQLRRIRPSVRLATPTTLFGRVLLDHDPVPPLSESVIAFSLSDDTDLPPLESPTVGSGLTRGHLRDTLASIVVSAVHAGARVSYGGDFRADGFGHNLADVLRSHHRLGTQGRRLLYCYVGNTPRPGFGGGEFDPIFVDDPVGWKHHEGHRDFLWHLAMRERMAIDSTARILLGGKSHPSHSEGDGGYSGPWPGMLEEAYRTLARGRGLFIVGGYGGCAGALATMLIDERIPAAFERRSHFDNDVFRNICEAGAAVRLALAHHDGADPRVLLVAKAGAADIEDLAAAVLQRWCAFRRGDSRAWNNGLSVEENLRLLRSTDTAEINTLIFKGLHRLAPSTKPGELSLRTYLGDISAVPEVEAYAVSVTPGARQLGASASLDKRLGGRIAAAQIPSEGVKLLQAGTAELSGDYVLVASLPLQDSADRSGAFGSLEAKAFAIGAECDRLGITSLACPLLGATLGVDVKTSLQAMLAGFTRARAPRIVTICEVDRPRYQALRGQAPSSEDLRPGPLPTPVAGQTLLRIVGTRRGASSQLESLALTRTTRGAAPTGTLDVPAADWNRLTRRFQSHADALDYGVTLWNQLLPPPVREELTSQRGPCDPEPVALLLNEAAAGLPWEALRGPGDRPLAITSSLTRRIAFCDGRATRPPKSYRAGRLRVLLISNPTRDLDGARAEAEAVATLLRARADVDLTHLAEGEATLSNVLTHLDAGPWDVLHYAGHASFVQHAPEQSGLKMADRMRLTSAHLQAHDVPQLVVLGACESGRVRRGDDDDVPIAADLPAPHWSLAEGFLRSGVRSLIGTFFVVDDAAALTFAVAMYDQLADGHDLGSAVLRGRRALYDSQKRDWANFMLYGDDTLVL